MCGTLRSWGAGTPALTTVLSSGMARYLFEAATANAPNQLKIGDATLLVVCVAVGNGVEPSPAARKVLRHGYLTWPVVYRCRRRLSATKASVHGRSSHQGLSPLEISRR